MATTYSVRRKISAPPEAVWQLLTDAGGYPSWNPAVLGIEGEIREGNSISLTSIVNPNRRFKLKVSDVRPPNHMIWSSGMPLGLFKGVRTFTVTATPDGASEFSMVETYSGVMEPLISKSIPDMTESFAQFGDGLKAAAEAQ